MLRKTTSLQDYETTSGAVAGGASPELRNHGLTDLRIYGFWFRCVGQRTMATLCYARQLVYETTSGAVAGGASQELRNYGTTDRASRLGTQSSVTLYTLLYSLYSQLTANCSHALALRCLLSLKSLRSVSEAPIITHSIFLKSSSTSGWDMVSISNILVKKVSYLRQTSFRVFALLFRIRFLYSLTILAYSSIATSSLSMSLSSSLPS